MTINFEEKLINNYLLACDDLLIEFPQHREYIELQKTWNEPILRYFSRWIPLYNGRVASIGSFLGGLEIGLSQNVEEIICCDIDNFLPVNIPLNLKFHKISLDTNNANMPKGKFDVCFCIEVIEHLRYSPLPMLDWMRRNCKFVVISSPDDNEWPPVKDSYWTTKEHFTSIPLPTLGCEGNPIPMEHCKQYSQHELVELLDAVGFRIIEFQRVGSGGHQLLIMATPKDGFFSESPESLLKNLKDKYPYKVNQSVKPKESLHKRALFKKGIQSLKEYGLRETFLKTIKKIRGGL